MSGGHIGIFPKGEPYELSPKLKTQLFGLLLEEICVEKMFDDSLVTNRAILDYKKGVLDQLAILVFFQRGDPMNLVQNEKLRFGLLLEEIRLQIMFDDRLVTNQALLDCI